MHPPTPRQPRPKLGFSEERCVRRVGCALGGAQHKHNTHAVKPSPVLSSRLASVSFTAGMPGQSKRHESPNTKPDQERKEKKSTAESHLLLATRAHNKRSAATGGEKAQKKAAVRQKDIDKDRQREARNTARRCLEEPTRPLHETKPPKKTGPRKQEAPLDRNAKKEQVAAAAPNGMQEGGKKRAGGATGATRPTHTTRSSIPTCPRRGCERRPGRYAVALQGTSKGIERRADDQLYRQVEYERQRKVIATPATWTLFLQSMKRVVELIPLPLSLL